MFSWFTSFKVSQFSTNSSFPCHSCKRKPSLPSFYIGRIFVQSLSSDLQSLEYFQSASSGSQFREKKIFGGNPKVFFIDSVTSSDLFPDRYSIRTSSIHRRRPLVRVLLWTYNSFVCLFFEFYIPFPVSYKKEVPFPDDEDHLPIFVLDNFLSLRRLDVGPLSVSR